MLPPFSRESLLQAGPGHALTVVVRFQEVDAAGVVFFPTFLAYMHDAFVSWLDAAGTPLPDVIRERRWIAPIAECNAEFLRPLRFGDAVQVRVVLGAHGRSSMRLGYRVDRGEEPVAVGQTVHVCLSEGRPTPLPDAITRAIAALSPQSS